MALQEDGMERCIHLAIAMSFPGGLPFLAFTLTFRDSVYSVASLFL